MGILKLKAGNEILYEVYNTITYAHDNTVEGIT